MRAWKPWLTALLAAAVLVAPGCTGNSFDDGDGPDVVLEIVSLDNPPVTASVDEETGACEIEVQDWTASLSNKPKSPLAVSEPYNDVVVQQLVIQYSWIDPSLSTPTRTVGLGDIAIPADGTGGVTFSPLAFDDLSIAITGHTANLTLTFYATMVANGKRITSTVTRQLFIEGCV